MPKPTTIPEDLINRAFRALENRDLDALIACFASDGVLLDPHYPYPEMRGHEAIRTGLQWALDGMKSMNFAQKQFFNSDDKLSGVVELDTHHVQSSGRVLDYLQIFVVETQDGLITRMQSYLPYGPNGIGGFFLRMSHKSHRRKHKA